MIRGLPFAVTSWLALIALWVLCVWGVIPTAFVAGATVGAIVGMLVIAEFVAASGKRALVLTSDERAVLVANLAQHVRDNTGILDEGELRSIFVKLTRLNT